MRSPASVRLAAAVYRVALSALPESFRKEYGTEMRLDAQLLFRERWDTGGPWSVFTASVGAVADILHRALVERRIRARRDGVNHGLGEMMMNWMRTVRLATRSLTRKPGFAAAAAVTLGVGLGSVVAIFTLVNAILLEPLPFPDADRLVTVDHHAPGIDLPILNNSPGTLALYWDDADFLEVAGVNRSERVLTGEDRPSRVSILEATSQYFDVMQIQVAQGRPLSETDNLEGAAPVAILTHDFWTSRFGSDPGIIGRTLDLDGVSTEVVGVLPQGYQHIGRTLDMMVPMGYLDPEDFGSFGITGVARLAPGISIEQARAQLATLHQRLPDRVDDIDPEFLEAAGWNASLTPLKESVVGDLKTTLWLVLGTVGFVLLIACANVANLFLVRAESRQKEVAVRAAMGAGRRQVAETFMSEALVLALAGGILGILVAQLGVGSLVRFGPRNIPRLSEVGASPTVALFAGGLTLLTGLFLGLVPLSRYSPRAFGQILRDGGRGNSAGRSRNRGRNLLVMGQLALALVLLVGSGLMFRSVAALRAVDLGFESAGVLTVEVSLGEGVPIPEAARFYEAVTEQIEALPGVQVASVTTQPPLSSGAANGGSFEIRGRPQADDDLPWVAFYRAVAPDYFQAMGIPLVAGRDMARSDMDGVSRFVWVDETFAQTHFPDGAVGQFISWDGDAGDEDEIPWLEIAGVVSNVRHFSLRDEVSPEAYLPLRTGELGYPSIATASLVVKGSGDGDVSSFAGPIRDIVNRTNGQVPVTQVLTMEQVISRAVSGDSITMVLLGIAALMALFLGAIGLFGIISYVVGQRTREIGVRIALGAERAGVSRMVLTQGLVVAVAGVAVGLVGAFALTRVMVSLLYGVTATDPLTFTVAPVLLLAVSIAATWLPAQRAARVDPVQSLREE